MRPMPPCGKDCPDRVVGCHAVCDKYQAYRAEIDAKRPQLYADSDVNDYARKIKLRIAMRRTPNIRRKWKKDE